jgi:hypothetical protein
MTLSIETSSITTLIIIILRKSTLSITIKIKCITELEQQSIRNIVMLGAIYADCRV